jgi:hypothetical protein
MTIKGETSKSDVSVLSIFSRYEVRFANVVLLDVIRANRKLTIAERLLRTDPLLLRRLVWTKARTLSGVTGAVRQSLDEMRTAGRFG